MPEPVQTILEFIYQFVGEGNKKHPNILRSSITGFFWFALLVLSNLRYKNKVDPHSRLLIWAFSFALVGAFINIAVLMLSVFFPASGEILKLFFPPLVRILADLAEFLIAGAYILFLTGKKELAGRFLKFSLTAGIIVYLASAIWWGLAVNQNPQLHDISTTWCDWAIRINACFWGSAAIFLLWRNTTGWARYWICTAFAFLFIDDFAQLVDMHHEFIYKNTINPLRSLLQLFAVILFGYIYIRVQASSIKSAFDSLEDTVAERTIVLQQTSEELKISHDKIRDFTSMVSHDLRNPLSSALMMAEMAKEQATRKNDAIWIKQSEALVLSLNHIRESLDSLNRRALEQNGDDHSEPVDLNHLIVEVENSLASCIVANNAKIQAESLPLIIGNSSKVFHLLTNLIENAIKYHGDTPPLIKIKAESTSTTHRIFFSDNGRGIPLNERESIFDDEFRGKRGVSTPGTGMGLSYCKQIVSDLGGVIKTGESDLGGACFIVELPV